MSVNAMDFLAAEIRPIMEAARANLSREVNATMLDAYWQVGRIIVEREQNGELKAQYFVFEFIGVQENKAMLEKMRTFALYAARSQARSGNGK
jgi:hypothetical protein